MILAKIIAFMSLLLFAITAVGEQVLFEDNFEHELLDKWQVVGLGKEDYRVRRGGLEMRVQPGKLTKETPILKLKLPFNATSSLIVSVKVSVLDDFTEDHEFAGVHLLKKSGPSSFRAKKERVTGKLVFSPGYYQFKGKPGEEGDPKEYDVKYTPATPEAGPLRIIVDRGMAFFQVGPSANNKYLNFFHSAIQGEFQGVCLVAAGAPKGASHWVRFESFRVLKP
jgi:hypothetical protein